MKHLDEVYTGNADPYLHLSSAQASDDGTRATHMLYNRSDRWLLDVTVDGVVVVDHLPPGGSAEFTSVDPEARGFATFDVTFLVARTKGVPHD